MALSARTRAADDSDEPERGEDGYQEHQSDAPTQRTVDVADALWCTRLYLADSLGAPIPPHRALTQEKLGDMLLFRPMADAPWSWLEPFPLTGTRRCTQDQAIRAFHRRTDVLRRASRVPRLSGEVLWKREAGSARFVRADTGLCRTTVELPLGEYAYLAGSLPFFGLGPPTPDATFLSRDGWLPLQVAPNKNVDGPSFVAPVHQAVAAANVSAELSTPVSLSDLPLPLSPPQSRQLKRNAVRFSHESERPPKRARFVVPRPPTKTWSTQAVFGGSDSEHEDPS